MLSLDEVRAVEVLLAGIELPDGVIWVDEGSGGNVIVWAQTETPEPRAFAYLMAIDRDGIPLEKNGMIVVGVLEVTSGRLAGGQLEARALEVADDVKRYAADATPTQPPKDDDHA
jgi:hypothetical protein